MVKIYNDTGTSYSDATTRYSVARIIYNDPSITYSSSVYTYGGFTEGVNYTRAIEDSEGILDSLAHYVAITVFANLSDIQGMTDTIDLTIAIERVLSETVGSTDSVERSISWGRTVVDSEGVTDALTRSFTLYLEILDREALEDNLEVFLPAIRKSIVQMIEMARIKPQISTHSSPRQISSDTPRKQITLQG